MRKICLLLLCVLSCNFSWSQNKSSYRDDMVTGNKLLAKKDYADALQNFLNAYSADSSNACLSYKIGYCIFITHENQGDALPYLLKASKKVSKQCNIISADEQSAPPLTFYYLGMVEQKMYHFADAIIAYKTLKTYMAETDKDYPWGLTHLIVQCNSAKMFVMAPSNAKIMNLGDSINSAYSDYNSLTLQDEASVIFTSSRPIGKSGSSTNGEYRPYIYISDSKSDSLWSTARVYDKNLNFLTSNTCSSITPDGQEMLLYCADDKGGALYLSRMGDEHWELPMKLESDINTVGAQSSACLSPDGNTLYFVSNRMGGMGGKDIWRCIKLPNGNWSRALDLGKSINTPYDEETPFMHADGHTFFFSSQGHNSMGGYDIFFSQTLDSGKFSEPFNLGYPINTPDDELHFSLCIDGKKGYFNSNRPGGKGKEDIYKVIMPHATERPLTVIRGQVLSANGQAISDDDEVHIIATDSASNQQVGDFKPIKATGKFTIIVPPGRTYTLSYQDNNNEFYKEVIQVPPDAGYKEIHKALTLSPHPLNGSGSDAPNPGNGNQQK